MSEVIYPWGPQQGSSSGVLPFSVQIVSPFPALQLAPTEAGGVFFDMQEVSGDTWFVTNAIYNTNAIGGAAWQQNNTLLNTTSINPANPAYAMVLKANGSWQRMFTAATNNVNTAIVWVLIQQTDANGNLTLLPSDATAGQIALNVAPVWNAGVAVMTAATVNVTDTASGAASKLLDLQVGSTSRFTVTKNGAVTIQNALANIIPLTVSGVAGQSVPVLAVTATSGGATFLGVGSTGVLTTAESATVAQITLGSGTQAQTGSLFYSGNVLQLFPQNSGSINFAVSATNSGMIGGYGYATALGAFSIPVVSNSGDLIAQRSASGGAILAGGATHAGNLDYNLTTALAWSIRNESGFAPFSGGVYTNASDASLKENVATIPHGLAELMRLNPVVFDWISSKARGAGFIAQEVQQVVPEAVSIVEQETGILGIADAFLTPVIVKAVQELSAKFDAYAAAHP